MKKITVKQTFEQGLAKNLGGAFKLFAPSVIEAEETPDGLVIVPDGRPRTLPPAFVEKLVGLDLIAVE